MRKSLRLAHAPLLAFSLFTTTLPRAEGAEGQALTNPLTAEEVACNERQLAKLLDRITFGDLIVDYNQIPKTLLVTYSNSHGFYEGLTLTNQDWRLTPFDVPPFPPPPEHYLAFNLNPSLRSLLLNPERPMLGQVSLNREQSSSNFVTPGGYFDMPVRLDPTLCQGQQRLGCILSQAATDADLIAPVLGGVGYRSLIKGIFHYDPLASPTFFPPATVDLEELLANTTWNNGFR